ncbi:hypothetical protein Brms1b_004879 [Colletotrichum noveboracense]|nr:hypothetical protein Brms1b_004879 [Colletotrichum noveboracense]
MDTDSALKSEKTATRAESVEVAESQTWDMHSTKKLLRKLDWHIIPFMSLIYLPSIWLTFIMVCWSAAMIGQGFVKDYSGLMATRVVLGIFEGGLFPGVNYYITQWYCRHECGFRMALFFSAATLAGAFGGILARGIAEMHGVGGLSAWAWIFILEGILSILVSFTAYWAIYDYPAT